MKKRLLTIMFALVTIVTGAGAQDANGHKYVDLGLPSGKLWATTNIGANSPEEFGDYFAWGETEPKETYFWKDYKYGEGSTKGRYTKYVSRAIYGYNGFTDNLQELELEDDAANANWGGDWRTPSIDDVKELMANTTCETTSVNGVPVTKFISKTNSADYIILPWCGYAEDGMYYDDWVMGHYWMSTYKIDPSGADQMRVVRGGINIEVGAARWNGLPVRAVLPYDAGYVPSKDIEEDDVVAIDVPLGSGTTKLLVTGLGIHNTYNVDTGEIGEKVGFVYVNGKKEYKSIAMAKADAGITEETTDDVPDYGYYRAVDPEAEGELTIPSTFEYNGVTYIVAGIGEAAFANCTKLTKINLPETTEWIDGGAFYFNKALQSIHIPAATEEISTEGMFLGCESLETITVDEANKFWDSRDNSNALILKANPDDEGGPIMTIARKRHAKDRQKAGTKRLENSDEDLGTLMAGCKNTVIPETVTAIGDLAFAGLPTLKTITIPENVEEIGGGAFMGSANLRQIIMKSATPPSVERYTFEGTVEGSSLEDAQDFVENLIIYGRNGGRPELEEEPGIADEDSPSEAKTFFAKLKALAKAKRAEAEDTSTGIPENYNDELDPQVYQHAALCVPTGAKEAYSEFIFRAETKANVAAKAAPNGNVNYWAWFTHIIEPVVIPESGVAVVSYDEDYDLPEDVDAYIVTQSDEDLNGTPFLSVEEVDEGAIPGGEAVIIKGEPGTELYVIPADNDAEVADVDGNLLVAVEEDTHVAGTEGDNSNYVIDENGNFIPANNDEVTQGGAYLQIPTGDAPETDKPLVIDWDGSIADGIVTVIAKELPGNAAIYDLQGRRIDASQLRRGVYIVKGQKVVVR